MGDHGDITGPTRGLAEMPVLWPTYKLEIIQNPTLFYFLLSNSYEGFSINPFVSIYPFVSIKSYDV